MYPPPPAKAMPILITGVTTGTSCFFPPDYVASKTRPRGDQMRAAEPQVSRPGGPRHELAYWPRQPLTGMLTPPNLVNPLGCPANLAAKPGCWSLASPLLLARAAGRTWTAGYRAPPEEYGALIGVSAANRSSEPWNIRAESAGAQRIGDARRKLRHDRPDKPARCPRAAGARPATGLSFGYASPRACT